MRGWSAAIAAGCLLLVACAGPDATTSIVPQTPMAAPAVSVADELYAAANAARARGDLAEALRNWRALAEKGDARGQNGVGVALFLGEGVAGGRRDPVDAAYWFRKAADQGDTNARNNLGLMYQSGEWIKRDYAEATRLFRLAAEQGNPRAQLNLAKQIHLGRVEGATLAEAQMWLRRAAEGGVPQAQFELGGAYREGLGVPRDFVGEHTHVFEDRIEICQQHGHRCGRSFQVSIEIGVLHQAL